MAQEKSVFYVKTLHIERWGIIGDINLQTALVLVPLFIIIKYAAVQQI